MSPRRTAKGSRRPDGGLTDRAVARMLAALPGWNLGDGHIRKRFSFHDHHEAVAFVNAVAWVSHREDHHPDLELTYNAVTLRYSTHSVGGLSEKDFVCAGKVETLMEL